MDWIQKACDASAFQSKWSLCETENKRLWDYAGESESSCLNSNLSYPTARSANATPRVKTNALGAVYGFSSSNLPPDSPVRLPFCIHSSVLRLCRRGCAGWGLQRQRMLDEEYRQFGRSALWY